jgi:hypothetical protein
MAADPHPSEGPATLKDPTGVFVQKVHLVDTIKTAPIPEVADNLAACRANDGAPSHPGHRHRIIWLLACDRTERHTKPLEQKLLSSAQGYGDRIRHVYLTLSLSGRL